MAAGDNGLGKEGRATRAAGACGANGGGGGGAVSASASGNHAAIVWQSSRASPAITFVCTSLLNWKASSSLAMALTSPERSSNRNILNPVKRCRIVTTCGALG